MQIVAELGSIPPSVQTSTNRENSALTTLSASHGDGKRTDRRFTTINNQVQEMS